MEFICRPSGQSLNLGQRNTAMFLDYIKKNPDAPWKLEALITESKRQRGFFEGALVPLVAFYQEGMDHRNQEDLRRVREWLKIEFTSEGVMLGGKLQRVAKSSKGSYALRLLVERTVEWLQENYQPPVEALNGESFKHWRDTVFPYGGPGNYIDYLVEVGTLKANVC